TLRRVPPALVTSLRPPRISSSTTSADSPSSRTELVFVLPRRWSGSARPSHHDNHLGVPWKISQNFDVVDKV
ncbi:unnamed protein product, partial [Musa hybrid cultivar]